MNSLIIPPSPNWYEPNILACATDNTLVYGSINSIVVVNPKPYNEPADIRQIMHAHSDKISNIAISPNWKEQKIIASASVDKCVKLWNCEKYEFMLQHKAHTENDSRIVGLSFAGKERIVSVSENGLIIVWRFANNEITPFPNLLGPKVAVTCLSSCPHAPWYVAFGTKKGEIILADIRKNGSIVRKMYSFYKSLVSLSWCPSPNNYFDSKVTKKNAEEESVINEIIEQVSTIELNKVKVKKNPWVDLKFVDDDEVYVDQRNLPVNDEAEEAVEAIEEENPVDFLGECLALKAKILGDDAIVERIESEECTPKKKEDTTKQEIPAQLNIKETTRKTEVENKVATLVTEEEFDVNTDDVKREYLLASSDKSGAVYVWRAATDGKIISKLHPKDNHRKGGRKNQKHDANVLLCWSSPTVLILTGQNGEIFYWDLLTKNKKATALHYDHEDKVFAIATPVETIVDNDLENWRSRKETGVWSVGKDRLLMYVSIGEGRKVLARYPTVGQCMYSMAVSPIDPNRIAIGGGDGNIVIWDLSRSHSQVINVNQIKVKGNIKMVNLVWHPSQETMLAFGTAEGWIGTVSTRQLSKPPSFFVNCSKQSVHSLEWGPYSENKKSEMLYVCSDGKVFIYDAFAINSESKNFEVANNEYVTQLAWKPDFTKLAFGTKNGHIFLYSKDLKLIGSIYHQTKAIEYLSWHPEATAQDVEISSQSNWLASTCTVDSTIVVYNLEKCATGENDLSELIVSELKGHLNRVFKMFWSPHESGTLCSVSEDGTARIWKLPQGTLQKTFINSLADPICCGIWSFLDPNYIITAGRDQSIKIWNLNECPNIDNDEITKIRTKRRTLLTSSNKDKDVKLLPEGILENKTKKLKETLFESVMIRQRKTEDVLEDCRSLLRLQEVKESDVSTEVNEKNCVLKLLGNQSEVFELLNEQENDYSQKQKHKSAANVALLKGDVGSAVKNAINAKTLTPWLISMAPMVSIKLWKEACEAYADSLKENLTGDGIEAASYYLACHKVVDAVNVLCTASNYKEALALAKSRLPASDTLIEDILKQWALNCLVTGRFELCAQNHIALGNYEEAAKALYKRNDLESISLALELAERCDNQDLISSIKHRYNTMKPDDNLKELASIKDLVLKQELDIVDSDLTETGND